MTDESASLGPRVQPRQFPSTCEGFVSAMRNLGEGAHRGAVEHLSQVYWRPLREYLRAKWGFAADEALDKTQAFYLELMERGWLRDFDPDKGRFRTFLRVLVDRFVWKDFRDHRRLKRAGSVEHRPLDSEEVSVDRAEAIFEREWREAVLRSALSQVKERYRDAGKTEEFVVFERRDLSPNPPSYLELARSASWSESKVRNVLYTVREALRTQIRIELFQHCRDEREFEDEWRAIVGL